MSARIKVRVEGMMNAAGTAMQTMARALWVAV